MPNNYPSGVPASTSDVHAPASNTAAVVTYAAVSGKSHIISGVAFSYDGTPTNGSIKIEDGSGTIVHQETITTADAKVVYFNPPKAGTVNTAMIVTLAAGGSGVSGKVSVLSHWLE